MKDQINISDQEKEKKILNCDSPSQLKFKMMFSIQDSLQYINGISYLVFTNYN